VANKDEVLEDLVDLLFAQMELPREDGRGWMETERELFSGLRRLLLSHPHAVSLLATHSARSVEALAPIETSLRTLMRAGFGHQGVVDGHRVLMSFTLGYLISEVSLFDDPSLDPNSWGTAAYALRDLPADELPHLAELAPVALAQTTDRQFDTCLTVILSGLKQALDAERSG